jgi:hypothetical protein
LTFRRRLGSLTAAALFLAPSVCAEEGGGLVGWVESTQGAPVAGAVISVFGKGINGGSLITLADSEGQFSLPSLPAGSYTLRALGSGHLPSAAERVTVLPNRDSLFTLSLTPVGKVPDAEATAAQADREGEAEDESRGEWRWLMRHKRRSVLESASHAAPPPDGERASLDAPALPRYAAVAPLNGSVELMALSNGGGEVTDPEPGGLPTGLGALRLQGQLAEGIHWSVGGLLAESESRSWRMAAEFILKPGGGHEIQTGAGYGAGYARAIFPSDSLALGDRPVGAFFIRDRWRVGERLTTSFGTRYTYIGFLSNPHHADAIVEVEVRGDAKTVVRGSVASRTLAPGGDLLTLSTDSASPAIGWADLEPGLRASRTLHVELGVDRSFRSGGRLGAFAFREQTRDQLWTAFEESGELEVRNAGSVSLQGIGFTVGHRFGSVVDGSVTYRFGRGARQVGPMLGVRPAALGFEEAEFHDLVARLETFIGWTDTRVAALYRVNAFSDDGEAQLAKTLGSPATTRFDVHVTQGLPFLQPLTRADWDLLVAISNLFYEASEGGLLDEIAVQDPPTRVVGGISVRF